MTSGVESVWKWVQKYEPVLSARSMLKIRIVHKGIILVAVPLLVGIVFNSLLCYDIYQTNRHVQRQLLLKDATISYIKSVRCATGTKLCMMSYLFSQDPYYKDSYQSLKKEALEANAHLKKLLKHEKGITIPELDLSSRNMMMGGRGRYGGGQKEMMASEHPFFQELNRMCNAETAYALQSLSTVQISMIVGVVISALIAIALAVFFCLNITNRLLIILSNTISLSKGTSLNPPLKGNDEIAELDQFLFKSANEIRVLERFKKQMIGVVSHELKSPLSSVASFLSSMSTGVYGEISQKAKDKIERAYASVKRLMGLVAELLYLDRLELEITPANVSVAEIIETSVDTVKELSEQSGIDLVVNNTAKQVFADRNRLVQVIVNLVSNAMKFSPAYGTVKIEGKESDAYFECRITDQGKGIPESFRKTIFEPFKQVVASDSTAKKGTGLGLTISKSIVEQHGGIIGVDSEEGKGSTFWFKIPISESAFAAARVPGGEPALLPAAKGKVNGNRKFSVLQQGLVIISVPLIFQVLFVAVVNSKIIQIREQTHREENSKEVLDILNRMSEGVTRTAQFGTMGVYAGNPEYLERWEHGKQDALDLLDRATKLSASDPLKRKDIDDTKKALDDISNLLSSESKKRQNQTKVEDFAEKAGLGEMLNIARKHPREMMAMESMDPQNPEAEISNPSGGMSQLFQMMRERGGQQHRSEQSGGVEGNLSRQRGTGTGANARSEGKVAELNVRPGRNESESKAGANAGAEARSEADPNANNEKVPVRGLSRLFQMMRRGGARGSTRGRRRRQYRVFSAKGCWHGRHGRYRWLDECPIRSG